MRKSILLLLGASGVGKSSLIAEIVNTDARFTPVPAYTTRPQRAVDHHRISISDAMFDQFEHSGELLALNHIYGFRYGTSKRKVARTIQHGRIALLDCPLRYVTDFEREFPKQIYRVYIEPPSIDILRKRLADGRDPDAARFRAGVEELDAVRTGSFNSSIDLRILNSENELQRVAAQICTKFWATTGTQWPARNTIKLKNDHYRNARGGNATVLEIGCARCTTRIMLYQKDGHGGLHRLYLNRIIAPAMFADLQRDTSIQSPQDMPNLTCAHCGNLIGTPMLHHEGRLAFRLQPGAYVKRAY